jgi:hypothetical protein
VLGRPRVIHETRSVPFLPQKELPGWPSVRVSDEYGPSIFSLEGGLDGLPLRAPFSPGPTH